MGADSMRVIEFYSRLWGGAYNIIIPTDGTSIDERFWTLIEAFDPDYIFQYRSTLEDVAIAEPDRYQEILNKHMDRWLQKVKSSDRAMAQQPIDEALKRTPLSPFDISLTLQEELKTRASPFWFQRSAVQAGALTAGCAPPFPLTDITKIIDSTEHPNRIAAIEAGEDTLTKLWYAAETGLLDSATQKAFEAAGVTVERAVAPAEKISQLVEFVVARYTRGFTPTRALSLDSYELESAPYRITMLQLGLYRSTRYEDWKERAIVVAGNTLEDFCLYYCLSRLRDRVVWALPSLTERALKADTTAPFTRAEINFVAHVRTLAMHSQQHERGLQCTTHSLTDQQLDQVIEQLGALGGGMDPETEKVHVTEAWVRFPLRAIEQDNFFRDIPVQLSGGRTVSPFPTPKPKHFTPVHPYEHRYITQLSIVGEAPPKHASLGELTLPDSRLGTFGARVGAEGPAYFCPNIAYFGGGIDTILVRPHIYLPSLARTVEMLTAKHGYECRPSDKGNYADESIAKWAGLENLVNFLRDEKKRAVLRQFLDRSKSTPETGVYLESEKRRYLGFEAIKRILGEAATPLIDELIGRQIFYRGFIFRCNYCRGSAWFSIGDLTHEFKCTRCGRTQVYTKQNWKITDEPSWFYKLDELIYQGYSNGMEVSLLALGHLKRQSRENFAFATDREFWKPGAGKPEAEADFFCVADGVLAVGEAKLEDCLGRNPGEERTKIKKYKEIALRLSVRQIVLATLSASWRPETIAAVASVFDKLPSLRILYLDSSHLL